MKIENNALNPLAPKKSEGMYQIEKNHNAADIHRQVAGKDKAEFSERARLLAKARTSFSEAPEIRADRVGELKQKIESGAYQVPFEDLAKKMMDIFRQK